MSRKAEEERRGIETAPQSGSGPEGGYQLRYDRARRLEHAPESVRWLATRWSGKRDGLFKTMFATKSSRFLFLTIIVLVLFLFLLPLVERRPSEGRLGADSYSVTAFWFEGRVFVSVLRSGAPVAEESRETITLRASAGRAGSASAASGVFVVGLDRKEDFRLAIAAEGGKPDQVYLRIESGDSGIDLVAKVQ